VVLIDVDGAIVGWQCNQEHHESENPEERLEKHLFLYLLSLESQARDAEAE
jgi:hypothetical protein